MSLYESVEPGNICIEWQTINDTGKALIDTWFLGILGIAEEHPVVTQDDVHGDAEKGYSCHLLSRNRCGKNAGNQKNI